jgi:hypothetical protein
LLFRLSVEARNWLIRWWLRLPAWWWLTARLVVVNGMGLGLVNGVGLGLEVVEPCRIWFFFFFLIF